MRTNAVRTENNVYYLPRPSARSAAIARLQDQSSRKFLTAGFYVITGGLIGLALANLPALSAAMVTVLNGLPRYL
jgi:hypothetical protein